MYISAAKFGYNTTLDDVSLHDGVPKQYRSIKEKKFGDWEIPPWELFIFKDSSIWIVYLFFKSISPSNNSIVFGVGTIKSS